MEREKQQTACCTFAMPTAQDTVWECNQVAARITAGAVCIPYCERAWSLLPPCMAGQRECGGSLGTHPPVPPSFTCAACPAPWPPQEEVVSVAGRVVRKAASGAKLIFFDLRSEGAKIQVMCDAR